MDMLGDIYTLQKWAYQILRLPFEISPISPLLVDLRVNSAEKSHIETEMVFKLDGQGSHA